MKLTVIDNLNLAPDDGVTYSVETSVGSIRIASGAANFTLSLSAYGWRKMGDAARTAFSCHYALYTRVGSTYTRRAYSSSKSTSWASGLISMVSTVDEVVVVISNSVMSANAFASALPTSILAKTSISVSKDGTAGSAGATGKMCYIVGEYSDDIEYTSNSSSTVAVEIVNASGTTSELWILTAATNVVGGVHIGPKDSGQQVWEQGLNTYNLIRTKYLFADFAQLGSGIVSGDWLFSMSGVIYLNGVPQEYGPSSMYANKPAYLRFDPDYPDSDSGYDNFIPNYAVDLKTGKSYQQAAYVRGTVMAENLFRKVCFVTDGGIYSEGGSNTGSADLVILVQTRGRKWTYDVANGYGTVYIPNPEDYQGKSIEIRHTVAPSNSDSARFLTLDEDPHFAVGLAYSNGSFEASTIQSQLMVSYGTTVILQSVNIGGSWYWLKVPS